MRRITRREFVGGTVKAATGAAVLGSAPGLIAGAADQSPQRVSANDRITVALIGCGGQGRSDLGALLRLREVECAAVCDIDDHHLGETAQSVADQRGRKPDTYRDFRKVLERKDVQAVVVATPDHWHALPTVMACQAGKDVYVEKPLAATIAEGRAMVRAARRYNRIVQVGTQQRSAEHFREAVDIVRSGELGRMRFVRSWCCLDWLGPLGSPADRKPPDYVDYDMWLGPAPARPFNPMRFHENFRYFWDYSGGLHVDWGAHMIDVALWALGGTPLRAFYGGGKLAYPTDIRETPDTQFSQIEFKDYTLFWQHMIGAGHGPWAREHGVEFHGENGILVVDRGGYEVVPETDAMSGTGRVYRMTGRPRRAASEDFHFAHVRDFVACLKTRETPAADVEAGHLSIIPSHLANISYRLGRGVAWDAAKEEIPGDPEAQRLVGRVYRSPWSLPLV
ncbi:MAG TPA: Gfo/Idh/MocA family oxidoreductase [Candidatus Bathyarchaeia archaeon]|nr:Gfo/Idh/MocA family oxidoreductase [Candidatus Bathyarchaeia archaeon]